MFLSINPYNFDCFFVPYYYGFNEYFCNFFPQNNNYYYNLENDFEQYWNTGLDTFTKTVKPPKKTQYKDLVNANLSNSQSNELKRFVNIYKKHQKTYENISEKLKQETGADVPPQLIAAIHYRESGCNFKTYLHNGDPLGKKTVHYPSGLYFDNFEDAAVDAIKRVNPKGVTSDNLKSQLDFAERYNGLGYKKKGIASPYVWAGTDKYKGGMYVADHKFSSTAKDKRIGVAVMIQELGKLA